jgi:RND family efflux transporter MFP subunit
VNLRQPKLWLPFAVVGGFALVALVVIATASEVETTVAPPAMTAVRVLHARPETTRLVVRSQGTVAPRTESELIPEVSGPVVWTSPSLVSGGFFASGDALLRIDRRDYQTALDRARASLARTEGELEYAAANLARLDGLAARDIASSSQHDDARRASRVAEASRDEARAQLDQAERDLARTEVKAPYTGRVREERVDVGQFLTRGDSMATIYATDYVEVRLPIPDHELAHLNVGLFQDAVDEDALPEVVLSARFAGSLHRWTGRIVRTEGEIDLQSRMVHVVARVEKPYEPGPDGRPPLAVGLFVSAEIAGPELLDVVSVPRSAVRPDQSVLVVDELDRLQRRVIEVLRIERDRVLIRGDLQPDERICISTVRAFLPGMSVRVIEAGGGASEEAARS